MQVIFFALCNERSEGPIPLAVQTQTFCPMASPVRPGSAEPTRGSRGAERGALGALDGQAFTKPPLSPYFRLRSYIFLNGIFLIKRNSLPRNGNNIFLKPRKVSEQQAGTRQAVP